MNEGTRKSTDGDGERAALAHLKKVDPALYKAALPHRGAIASRVKPKRTNAALFEAIASSIVSQQLSTKAAASIFARLRENLGGKVTPAAIDAASPALLRSSGLSEAKVLSLKGLASAVLEKKINLLALRKVSAEEAVAQLSALRGIGPWTAEMFLIFALGAPDVFSPGDLILARWMQRMLNLRETTSQKEMAKIAERWSPHRSFVALLFWKLHHAEND